MAVAAFDTLRLARSLREKAKLSPEQAEGFADAIAEMMQGDLATKSDIGEFKADARDNRAELEARIREAELRLEKQIEASKAEILKWMFGTIGLQTLAILGAVLALARVVRI